MKNIYYVFILIFMGLWSLNGRAQEKYKFGNVFMFDQTSLDTRFMVRSSSKACFPSSDLSFARTNLNWPTLSDTIRYTNGAISYASGKIDKDVRPKSPIMLGVKLNPELTDFITNEVNSISRSFSCYIINDSSEATLIALGITEENIKDYKYHVVENDGTEIIPWSPIPKLEQNYGSTKPYAFLGNYKAPSKFLMIEVVNKKNYSIRDGVVLDWRVNYKPTITQITVTTPKDYFNINYKKLNRNYATKFDPSGVPLDLKFPQDSVIDFRLFFKSHPTCTYIAFLKKEIDGKTEIEELEDIPTGEFLDLNVQHFKVPGKYELIIQRAYPKIDYFGKESTLRFPFEVLPPITKNLSTKQVTIYGTGVLLLFSFVFVIYLIRSKQKLKKASIQKEKATLQLKAIRSQLNPHFTFNALNSIQNLMNKSDIEAANHYLAKFASLTRRVLNTGEQDLISLTDEITLLDDYLQMEQLRFGFNYVLNADEGLNKANIEIPAMLLQPFVENAVKHGVAAMREKGQIEVGFNQKAKDLVLSVSDNGKGFQDKVHEPEKPNLGLKLSKERITLLNKTYAHQRITMNIVSETTGTKVEIMLGDWL